MLLIAAAGPARCARGAAEQSVSASGQSSPTRLSSMEFKMLLVPALFGDEDAGASAFWRIARAAALDQGLTVTDSSVAKAIRYLAYLDTPDFALNKKGYILRLRQGDPVDYPQVPSPAAEFTLKFRSADSDLAASKDVSPGPGYGGKSKFEKDVVLKDGALKEVFSKSADVEISDFTGITLEKFTALYPALGGLSIATGTVMGVVNDKRVEEHILKPGVIMLSGGVKAKASIAIWRYQRADDNSAPFVAEFSFSFAVKILPEPAEKAARAFMTALAASAAEWAHRGGTKTELIYGEGQGGAED
ncbi:MAG: hypothetical protein WCK75_10200 [Elusimicrobiota bacterium]